MYRLLIKAGDVAKVQQFVKKKYIKTLTDLARPTLLLLLHLLCLEVNPRNPEASTQIDGYMAEGR